MQGRIYSFSSPMVGDLLMKARSSILIIFRKARLMDTYSYRITGRHWTIFFALIMGLLLICIYFVQSRTGRLNMDIVTQHGILFLGAVISLASLLTIFGKYEWSLYIDDNILSWVAGKKSGKLCLSRVTMIIVDTIDWSYLRVYTDDGKCHRINGDCYGSGPILYTWLQEKHGMRIKIYSSVRDMVKDQKNK